MANPLHLGILEQGVNHWNEWRKNNPEEKEPDLIRADLKRANLVEANLKGVNLTKANLYGANLTKANLFKANLRQANLTEATLIETELQRAYLDSAKLNETNASNSYFQYSILTKANLTRANLNGANFREAQLNGAKLFQTQLNGAKLIDAKLNLANLTRAILIEADLMNANLERAIFKEADLSEANLQKAQALETNFYQSTLTGACLKDWNYNDKTNFTDVTCKYFYERIGKRERRPSDESQYFTSEEFTKLFQIVLKTVDLIFTKGINWQVFLSVFQELQEKAGSAKLAIQKLERKSEDAFIVRIEVPPDANKAEVEKYLKREYEIQLKTIEDSYRLELNAKSNEIEIYKQQNANINEIVRILASNPINVYQTQGNNMPGDRNIQIGTGNYVEKVKGNYIQGNYYAAGEKQSLAEAAAEIQELLKQLEKTNPTATDAQKEVFVSAGMTPTKKEKLINALKEGGKGAVEEFFDNPYVNVAIKIIEGWKNA